MKYHVDIGINNLVEELANDKNIDSGNVSSDSDSDSISSSKRWEPKKWKIEYERIVMYDLAGLKGYEIAEKMNCTPQHVYNVLGCEQAQAIQKALIGKIRNEGESIVESIEEIQKLTVKRLKNCLKDDEVFKESRLGFIAKGIDVMKGSGEYLKNAPTTQVNNQFVLPPSIADKFIQGLEKSDEARKLLMSRNRNIEEAEIINDK